MKRRRPKQTQTDLVWDGRASRWSGGHADVLLGRDPNLQMCAHDLGTEIWVHFHRLETGYRQYETEPLRLEACSDQLRDILIGSLRYNEYRKDLSGAVMNFAKMVAQELVIDGVVPFEVLGGWDRSGETPRLEEARLVYVCPDSMLKLGPWLFQVVPPDATSEGAHAQVIRLNPSRIVTFKPPRRYRNPLAGIRAGLPLIGQSQRKWMMSVGKQSVQEDFNAVARWYNVRLARLSAPIGWNGRSLFRDHIADFHWACRQLQWHRFCIEVRDAILTTLGRVFTMIGEWRGEVPRLVWAHLPTVEQVRAAEAQIMGQGARFDQVLQPFMLPAEQVSAG